MVSYHRSWYPFVVSKTNWPLAHNNKKAVSHTYSGDHKSVCPWSEQFDHSLNLNHPHTMIRTTLPRRRIRLMASENHGTLSELRSMSFSHYFFAIAFSSITLFPWFKEYGEAAVWVTSYAHLPIYLNDTISLASWTSILAGNKAEREAVNAAERAERKQQLPEQLLKKDAEKKKEELGLGQGRGGLNLFVLIRRYRGEYGLEFKEKLYFKFYDEDEQLIDFLAVSYKLVRICGLLPCHGDVVINPPTYYLLVIHNDLQE
ncbi:hypothetical protein HAX54_025810 [Datura stramonium]|uniref:Uncharacterized protein n=1 Tax=Datura stramonium TaxID=4076 RepID=A0ABS8V0B9_DATST|nr:hypothetical protein [Datura stramonium]